MELYDKLAQYYEDVFPLNPQKIKFIQSITKGKDILEVGCATGALSVALSNLGYNTTGIDLNEQMIAIAKEKKLNCKELDMLKINELEGEYDVITCLGNTLPHLKNIDQIQEFISKACDKLKDSGVLILQFINFTKDIEFPVIETKDVIFKRKYTGNIIFHTSLMVDGQELLDETPLYPVTKDELNLNRFTKTQFFSDFLENEYTEDKDSILIVCKK
jgi:glycine/sarcosine N-methyltransferase